MTRINSDFNFYVYRRYSATGKAVYHTAALGVVLDPKSNEQKCFGGKQTKMVAKN
jgi:hypothetical protein